MRVVQGLLGVPRSLGFRGKMGLKVMSISSLPVFATPTLGSRSGIFDVVGGNRGCSNVRLCELFMTY